MANKSEPADSAADDVFDLRKFEGLIQRLQLLTPPDPRQWTQHPNGRGWVEKTAQVDDTAYVGPSAIVLENAKVLQNAKILGRTIIDGAAIVTGNVTVAGDSKIREMAVLAGDVRISGESWVGGNAALTSGDYENISVRPWTKDAVSLRNKVARSLSISELGGDKL